MERLDNLPEQNGASQAEYPTAESLLRSVTQDLRALQQDLLTQLNQDINRLQAEKSRLINDVEKLQNQQQALKAQHEVDLSQQQLAQQQAWAKQLALVLANHLQAALNERLSQTLGAYQTNLPQISGSNPASDQSSRLAASLDDTVNRTFASLRHDITSYQSSLAQQLERMHTLGQQGEAILEVLVKRLSHQLHTEAKQQDGSAAIGFPPREISPPTSMVLPLPEPGFSFGGSRLTPQVTAAPVPPAPVPSASGFDRWTDALINPEPSVEDEVEMEPEVEPIEEQRTRRTSHLKLGLGFVFLSAFVISLHYVTVGLIGNTSQLFGNQSIGGYLSLSSFSNAALLLWIRMLVVVPVMVLLANYLHPPTLRDIRAFSRTQDRRMLWSVIGSGVFLFLSQVFLYMAIGQIGPGVAVTVLFLYPVGTLIFSWLLFAEKLTLNRLGIIAAILLGALLALYPLLMATQPPMGGIITALLAVVSFTLYLVAMQIGARRIHPIPVSLLQFATMFVLGSFSLIVLGISGPSPQWTPLLVSGVILGGLTVGSYVLNHIGIRAIGATRAAIIAASTPTLVALLGFFLVPGPLTTLKIVQIVGILLVTLAGTALSLERMLKSKSARPKLRPEG